MYSLMIENTLRPGQKFEFQRSWQNDIVPFLKTQPGFLEATLLSGLADHRLVVGLTVWSNEADAQRYLIQVLPEVAATVSHLFEFSPIVRTFLVGDSEARHNLSNKAA